MSENIEIKVLEQNMIPRIVKAIEGTNVARSEEYLVKCLKENALRKRITYVAMIDSDIVGLVNLIYESEYPFFRENNIPEINDLLVHPAFRKQGFGLMLINKAEQEAREKYNFIGLGVGLYRDYGPAQRLYIKNGYIPDGNGIVYKNIEAKPGNYVFLDDDLLIYLCKAIK